MPSPEKVYIRCDDLDAIPLLMKDNYLFETEQISKILSPRSTVLQIGSMDGERAIRLQKVRPDLKISGLEIEKSLVEIAKQKIARISFNIKPILGDITNPPKLAKFDYVICLNNTLGYIPNQQKSLDGMISLGNEIIVSVYGEKFTNSLAKEYFDSLGLSIKQIKNNEFIMEDFSTVKRYTGSQVKNWASEVINTPVGYFCIINPKK